MVLGLHATLITCHSEKEQAAPACKGGFGFQPLLCFLAGTGKALPGRLRPGNAGANTAADRITVLDQALAQIPAHPRRPPPALADIGDLVLETRTGHGLPPPGRTAPARPDRQTPARHDSKGPGEPDHRAGTPTCPSTEISSATRQLPLSDASSPQPKQRG